MSRNHLVINIISVVKVVSLALLGSFALSWGNVIPIKQVPISNNSEDMLIIEAIFDEGDGNYTKSRDRYEKLFALTGKKEYLIREAQDALAQRKDINRSIANLTRWVTEHPTDHDRKLYLILTGLYIQNGALQEAGEIVDAYLTKWDTDAIDLEEFGKLKMELGEYKKALELFKRSYEIEQNDQLATDISALYLLKLSRPDKAAEILQKHIDNNPDASIGIYFKLIELYAKEHRLDKVLKLYKKLYQKDPQDYFMQKIIEISQYEKDTEGLIKFLEDTQGNEDLLYSAYKNFQLFDKATALAKKMYKNTKNSQWIAEEAILVYEKADKNHNITPEVLKQVFKLFKEAIAKGAKHAGYLNYYGYVLIDHDIDVDKGIGLVRRALGEDPNNPYYLDSLAWGLYKKGECKKALLLMKKVINKIGNNEPEVNNHYKAVEACFGKGKKENRE